MVDPAAASNAWTDAIATLPTLEQLIDRSPLTVTPDTLLSDAIAYMRQRLENSSCLINADAAVSPSALESASCILVVEGSQLVGMLTEGDVVRLTISGVDGSQVPIAQVMTQPLTTLTLTPATTLQSALALLAQHQIRHLPIVDEQGQLIGLVTRDRLYQGLEQQLQRELSQRQQMAAALQHSQQQLQTIFNQTFQLIGLLRSDGVLLDANPAALEFVGTTIDQVVEQPFWETPWWTHDPEQQQRLQAAIAQAAAGQFVRSEFTHRSATGTIETFDFSIKPVFSDAGQVISLVAEGRNIHDRKQMERQLQTAYEELERQVAGRTHELTQAEEQFRILATYAPVGIFQTDAVGDCVFVNHRWLELTGLSLAQAMGKGWVNALHPEDRERVINEWYEGVQAGRDFYLEYRFQTSHDRVHWVIGNAIAIRDEVGTLTGYLGTLTDITDRVRVETDRRRLETERQHLLTAAETARNQVVTILESITDGFIAFDHDWHFTYVNAQAGRILQRDPADLLGKLVWSEFANVTETAFYREYRRAVAEQVTVEFEEFYPPLNTWFAVHAYPSADGLVAYFQDITQRKQAEAKIREQAALLDISTDAIYVRSLDNCILYWNSGAEKMYGWSAEAAIGKNSEELFQTDTTQLQAAMATTLQQGSWQGELHKTTRTGQTVIVDSRWSLVNNDAGQPRAILTVSTDITEKKQLEAQFLRAQRLESIGTLASGIAHDLNNILTPVLTVAQLLPRRVPQLDESTQHLLEILEANAKRGSDLVKQILAFARGSQGERTTLQIGHLLAEVTKIAQQTFPKSIQIQTQVTTTGLWCVRADATQLHQVIMNLCVNARDAMPAGGRLTIAAENSVIDATFARRYVDAQVGAYVKMTIADTGTGIAPDIFDKIFDPFFTTKAQGQGTGLGLSTVRTIIKNHGGFLDVRTQVGSSTSFNVYLPAIEPGEELPIATTDDLTGNNELSVPPPPIS
jgi:PAS domain S-box-containing protein